ncbi:cytochrome P450 4V2-like [Tetranychus urticae]|uniref:cytochrome P450 4V2-like n=1 Tax=Tetranychus urticae TaxID=32264 RepID=UPI00077BBF35|nr:cytochrome P450 4V2-like [Tetranychus urticae]
MVQRVKIIQDHIKLKVTKVILSSRHHINKGLFYKIIAPFMKDGLITSKGDKWRNRRRLIGPAFNTTIISQFIPLMINNASMLVKSFREASSSSKRAVNIVDYIHLTSMDIICKTAMGISPEAQSKPSSLVVQAVTWMTKELAHRIYNPFLWVDLIFVKSPMGQSFRRHLQNFEHFTHSIIHSKLKLLRDKSTIELEKADQKDSCNYDANNNVNNVDESCYYKEMTGERKAFLDLLLEKHLQPSANDGKPIIDLEGVQEEISTFLFAGYETTGTAIMWIIYLLGLHTEVQDKIHAEINSILDDNIDDLSYNQIHKFNYLDQCIKEGLRLFPPVPMIARELDQEVILDGFKIPRGASVAIMIYSIHRDPIIYPDPDSFNPDRFDSDHISSIPAYAYIPFSAGPRVCIGQRFALIEMKIILIQIIKNFRLISTKPLNQIPYEFEVTIRPKVPLDVNFIPRNSNCDDVL